MIEETLNDQEIESDKENSPPFQKTFKFMAELNKFQTCIFSICQIHFNLVNIDSPCKSLRFFLNDPFSLDSARNLEETYKTRDFKNQKSYAQSVGKSNKSVNFYENCIPHIKTNTLFKDEVHKNVKIFKHPFY